MAISKRQVVHGMFDVAVAVKAFNGVLEIAGGSFLALKLAGSVLPRRR